MSYDYYSELWLIARNDLEKLLELDQRLRHQRKTERREEGLNLLLPTYLRYRNLAKRLIVCHDQMVQSQKRDLIKRVLDCSIGRMLEYKREIVQLNCSDYLWPDDSMKQFKYTPDDLDLSVSATGKDVLRQRRKFIEESIEDALKAKEEIASVKTIASESESIAESEGSLPRLRRRKIREKSSVSKSASVLRAPSNKEMIKSREVEIAEKIRQDAILLVQSHERARRARCAGFEAQRIHNYKKKVQTGQIIPKKMSRVTFVIAARTIQRAWRNYLAKKKMKKRRDRIEELLDMTIPSWKSRETLTKDEENFQKRLETMPLSVVRVAKMTDDTRARLWKIRGPGLMEDITDEIREWFIIWYDTVGHYDVYPAARLGGSVLIATGQTLTPEEYLMQKNKAAAGKSAKDSGTKKKKNFLPWITETKAASLLDDTNQDFIRNWSFRDRTNYDPREKVYEDLIKDRLCYELQLEMRSIVDELMRLELQKLNTALARDYKTDKRELNIPKDKSKKGKGKKKRKKKKGDDVPVQDIFEELARANIIRNYPVTSLNDWIGDLSYQNYEADREFRDYNYRMGEVKQTVMDYCIIPLSSKEVHQIAPLIRAVCISGLPRYGKSFLVDAVCSEVGALLFDMTPNVLVGKYLGRKNERKLINMISRVAREYAPSIIFIDNGEKPWLKKVPPEERQYQPKRFARHYSKLVKSIKRGDQILFLTTSSEPYKASRPFVRIHDKFIMIPLTDYNTLYMFYKDLLMKYHGIDRNIDVSCLAKISVSIPLEFIRNALENVLNLRRRITLKFKPLNQQEIMEEVLKYEPPSEKTLKQLKNFENRTPLGRMRIKLLAIQREERERLEKQKKAKK